MVSILDLKRLQAHRARTFRIPPAKPLTSMPQARRFVDARGFCYFWPITGIDLPSLWTAVAGNRPVADEHDDAGHVTWRWKDNALDKRVWYYGKILRRKATMISLDTVPFFYALSQNYGAPEEDYLLAYEQGHLTQSARQVYEALLNQGALNTLDLRRAAKLSNAKESEFTRALESLQSDFKVLPVGVAEAGAWRYAHIYDIVPRHYPWLPQRARKISESAARIQLSSLFFASVGAAQVRDVVRLFGWSREAVSRTIASLVSAGALNEATHPSRAGSWLAIPKVCR